MAAFFKDWSALIKLALLGLWLVPAISDFTGRLAAFDAAVNLIVYLCSYVMLIGAVLSTSFARNKWFRIVMGIILCAGTIFYEGFRHVSGTPPTYDTFISVISSKQSTGDAIIMFFHPIALAVGQSISVLIAIVWKVPSAKLPFQRLFPAFAIVPIILISAMLYMRGGDGAKSLPPAYPGIGFAVINVVDNLVTPKIVRQDVTLPKSSKPKIKNIIYIVDESIAAKYLDINHKDGVRSGLKRTLNDSEIVNFGIGTSAVTCSISANLTLRYGGTRENFVRMNEELPSIFAYANAAGMRTSYINVPSPKNMLTLGFTEEERSRVDNVIYIDPATIVDRDHIARKRIAKIVAEPGPQFILINKLGAHFPVHDKVPDKHIRYRPILARGNWTNITDTGDRTGFDGSKASWQRYRNSYRNTLEWNVGVFFDGLFGDIDLSETAIIYTSDHGQRLHEAGFDGVTTHCDPSPRSEDGAVPLVMVAPEDLSAPYAKAAKARQNNTSHFRIFPTLLTFMGYDRQAVEELYGEGLDSPEKDPMTFISYYNARMGREPSFYTVDLDALPDPPVSDIVEP